MTTTGGLAFGGRFRWVGSIALLATSIWTGVAGGFGLYTKQVGFARAFAALAVAYTAIETGKPFAKKTPHPHLPPHVKLPAQFR